VAAQCDAYSPGASFAGFVISSGSFLALLLGRVLVRPVVVRSVQAAQLAVAHRALLLFASSDGLSAILRLVLLQ
jgi:hypothetical protein